MRKLFSALLLGLMLVSPAHAQKTKAALTTEINTNWPDNTSGAITPALLRSTVLDIVNSYYDLAGGTTLSCAAHTWVSALPTLSSITCTQPNMGDLGWTNVRAGDVAYWNGSTWAILAGNNSGTQFLSENASGVPSWSTSSSSLSFVTNSLGSDTALNNTANYFDGPSTAQGTSGTWLATGAVSVLDTGGAANVFCKLWDGTTVIDSRAATTVSVSPAAIPLSGVIASPVANIKISCRDTSATTGKILFNQSGNSKDATLTVVRIQ